MTDRGTLKVLVAEDEPAMLSLVARHLRRLGFSVTEASDGDMAWDLAQQARPDLVLLDVMMPGMSGWEVCKRLKGDGMESAPFRKTGVIMLTGIGDNLNEMTSPLFEADAWLNKPFYFPDLERKIRETLGKYNMPMPIADLEDDEEAAAEEEASLLEGDREDDEDLTDEVHEDEEPVLDVRTAPTRRAPARKAPAPRKAPARKASAKKGAATKKGAAKKTSAKKGAAKKASARKGAAKKTSARKGAAKKAPARKAPAKKTSAKKASAKKGAAKKASAKKAPAKKTSAKKAPAGKAPARKSAGRATKKPRR